MESTLGFYRSQARSSQWYPRHSAGNDLVWPVPNILGAGSEVTYVYGIAIETYSLYGDATPADSWRAH